MTNNKWVTYEQAKPLRWQALFSTDQRRIATVTNSGTVLAVAPVGIFRVKLFPEYSSLAFIDMNPKQVTVDFSNVRTDDHIAVVGSINIHAFVVGEDRHIKQMVSNAENAEHQLRDCVTTAVRENVVSRKWYEVIQAGEGFVGAIHEKLLQLLKSADSCFSIKNLAIHEISPVDKALAEIKEREVQAVEEEHVKKKLATLQIDRAEIEREAKKKNVQGDIEIKRLQDESDLDWEQRRAAVMLESRMKWAAILTTEAGQIASLPDGERLDYLKALLRHDGTTQQLIGVVAGMKDLLPDNFLHQVVKVVPLSSDDGGTEAATEQDNENAAAKDAAKHAEPGAGGTQEKPSDQDKSN